MQDPIVQEHPRDIAAAQARPEARVSFRPSTWTVLLRVAASAVDGSSIDTRHIPVDTGWAALAADAEAHGLAPLAHLCLGPHRDATPEATMQQLDALMLRHRLWHRERTVVLADVLEAFQRASIDAIVLKGAALAWTIYASPALRPMSDVDLLLPPAAVRTAQLLLRQLRFEAQVSGRRFGRNAHHLPIASRSQNGVTISVEIHRDALSRDTLSSIAMTHPTESARLRPGGTHLRGTRRHLRISATSARAVLERPTTAHRARELLRYGLTFNSRSTGTGWRPHRS